MSRILPTPLVFISGYANTENVFYCLSIKPVDRSLFTTASKVTKRIRLAESNKSIIQMKPNPAKGHYKGCSMEFTTQRARHILSSSPRVSRVMGHNL